jgi:hypothetical protein
MTAWDNLNRVRHLIQKLDTTKTASLTDISNVEDFKTDLKQSVYMTRPVSQLHNPLRIGVDMYGVCMHILEQYENNDVVDHMSDLNMEGCVEALRLLSDAGHTLVLVTFCGRRRANNTRDMLLTKFPNLFDELYFVKHMKFKHTIAISRGLDIMIDDRLDVLDSMTTVTPIHFIADVPLNRRNRNKKRVLIEADYWGAVVNEIANQSSKCYTLRTHSNRICY